jgi:hypothetical protein
LRPRERDRGNGRGQTPAGQRQLVHDEAAGAVPGREDRGEADQDERADGSELRDPKQLVGVVEGVRRRGVDRLVVLRVVRRGLDRLDAGQLRELGFGGGIEGVER